MTSSFCYACDKSRERDVNHWFNVIARPNRKGTMMIIIKTWNLFDARTAETELRQQEHQLCTVSACGQAHAMILVERFLNTGRFEK